MTANAPCTPADDAATVYAATSAALNPLVDISGCPGTVAQVAAPTTLRAAAEVLRHDRYGHYAAAVVLEWLATDIEGLTP